MTGHEYYTPLNNSWISSPNSNYQILIYKSLKLNIRMSQVGSIDFSL